MRILIVLIAGCLIGAACSSDRGGATGKRTEGKTEEKAVSFVQNQLMSQVRNAEVDTIAGGMITIKGEGKGFVLDPSRIVTGLIDDDNRMDAVMPVYSLSGQSLAGVEYLVLLQAPSEFVIAATLTNILSIEAISDRMITAVVSTVTQDTPGYGCKECQDTVQYRYVNGEMSVISKVDVTQ